MKGDSMRAAFLAVVFFSIHGFAAFDLTWGIPAISLDSNPPVGDTDLSPTIAIDAMGNAVATWSRTTGTGAAEDIWADSYHHASRSWTGAVKISGGGSASRSVVGLDGEGNAWIVWEEGFPTQIFSRTLSAAGEWSPPLSQAPAPVCKSLNAQEFPQLVVDQAGNALAIWMEVSGSKTSIRSARRPFGSGWESLGLLSSGTNQALLSPPVPIAINASGDAAAVWQESGTIYGAQYIRGAWTSPMAIASGTQPAVGIGGMGEVVFVWNQGGVIQSKILSGSHLSEPMTISNALFAAERPCVALDDAGNAVAVFERLDAAGIHKFIAAATLLAKGASWSTPIDLSVPSSVEAPAAGYPKLCLNGIGDGVAIWKEFDGSHMTIQGAGYSLGTWSFIRTLSSKRDNSGSPFPSYDMAVSLNAAGNIMAVWPEDPSGRNTQHIKAASGAPIKAMPGVGIAVEGPLPPVNTPENALIGIGKGLQVRHRFPAHSDLINIIDWISPGGVAGYNVYRGNLSSLIATTQQPHYEDHCRVPGEKTTYLITSVDSNGHESGPMAIIVSPL
jgi:hypothetical protein